jgi:hypothetical protein
MTPLWPRAALALAALALLGVLAYVETARYDAQLERCYATLATHIAFTGRSVCTSDAQRDAFERADLVRCTAAELYVRAAHPRICALKAWFADSWLGEVWRVFSERLLAVWLSATGSVALLVVLPVVALFAYWIRADQRGKTERAALQTEQFTALADVVEQATRMRRHYASAAGALPPASPYVEDVSEDAGEGEDAEEDAPAHRKTDIPSY